MRTLITGAAGFVGGHLGRLARSEGSEVFGLDVRPPDPAPDGFPCEVCDVRDGRALHEQIVRFQPDRVFHLAAQSFPTVSLTKPWETMEINAGGTIQLFESLRAAGLAPMVVVACSSAEYGPVAAKDLPVREDHILRPLHPYGVSKVAQDLLAYQYFQNYGLPSVRIRIFNTTGPGKLGDVCSDITRRAAEIELGLREPRLPIGNQTTRRSLLNVRDLVRALWLAAERCPPGEVYNVGGDAVVSVAELVVMVRELCRVPFEIVPDESLRRPSDEPVIAGDTRKFEQVTGWRAATDVRSMLGDMLGWWRERLRGDRSGICYEAAASFTG